MSEYVGRVVIRWPVPAPGAAMAGWRTEIIDADTGKPITTISKSEIRVTFDPAELVTVLVTMFADLDGKPILDGMPVADPKTGDLRTGVFLYQVERMEVR